MTCSSRCPKQLGQAVTDVQRRRRAAPRLQASGDGMPGKWWRKRPADPDRPRRRRRKQDRLVGPRTDEATSLPSGRNTESPVSCTGAECTRRLLPTGSGSRLGCYREQGRPIRSPGASAGRLLPADQVAVAGFRRARRPRSSCNGREGPIAAAGQHRGVRSRDRRDQSLSIPATGGSMLTKHRSRSRSEGVQACVAHSLSPPSPAPRSSSR